MNPGPPSRFDAYGRTKVFNAAGAQLTPGPQPTERLYTGQVWDWNANVFHYVARVYVPELARFTSTDPVRECANPYAYVKWAPTALVDPMGMSSFQFWLRLLTKSNNAGNPKKEQQEYDSGRVGCDHLCGLLRICW